MGYFFFIRNVILLSGVWGAHPVSPSTLSLLMYKLLNGIFLDKWHLFCISKHGLKSVSTQNLFFSSTVLAQPPRSPAQPLPSFLPPPPPLPPTSLPLSRFLYMVKIRVLFLELCDSFSEYRRDLCSSYFYCKSNSLEKNVICKKALFLSGLHVKL